MRQPVPAGFVLSLVIEIPLHSQLPGRQIPPPDQTIQRFDALRDAVAAVATSLGELDWRSDEREAIALIRVLGKCGPVLATVIETTEEQEKLRIEIHDHAANLEDAIRLAIGRPHQEICEGAVITKVRTFRPMVHKGQRLFVWPPPK